MLITHQTSWHGESRILMGLLFGLLSSVKVVSAIELDLTNQASIIDAAAITAAGLVGIYKSFAGQPGGIPGNLPAPYYWWEAGATMMSLIDYWYYTGDDQYNDLITEGILWQVGPEWDFMTPNQTKTTGNDDQAFWAFAAMDAAEFKFPDPPAAGPQWLALAQAVFNTQAKRWDNATCGGGLKWQVFPFNTGYNYKNTISNGCFFNLAARLYRYTGNETYADWAVKMYDWVESVGLINDKWEVFDGSDDVINCTRVDHNKWTYNLGVFLHGAANMWDKTNDPIWKARVDGFVSGLPTFFTIENIMREICEDPGVCNYDQRSFKAYLSRWMAATTLLAPWTEPTIVPYLKASAVAAAQQCSGGSDGTACGLAWTNRTIWDGMAGPGEQMAAMQVIAANLISGKAPPVTNETGGTSKGDANAGSSGDPTTRTLYDQFVVITKGDRAGAWMLTVLFVLTMLGGGLWTVLDIDPRPDKGMRHWWKAGEGQGQA